MKQIQQLRHPRMLLAGTSMHDIVGLKRPLRERLSDLSKPFKEIPDIRFADSGMVVQQVRILRAQKKGRLRDLFLDLV